MTCLTLPRGCSELHQPHDCDRHVSTADRATADREVGHWEPLLLFCALTLVVGALTRNQRFEMTLCLLGTFSPMLWAPHPVEMTVPDRGLSPAATCRR